MVHTSLRTRNYTVAGDYLACGWITDDRKHMLRIMRLNEDYTKLDKDVIVEIDCPPGNDGRLMVRSIICKRLADVYYFLSRCATICGCLGSNPGYS